MQKNLYDLAIIGGGPGGLSASIYAARSNLKTILLEKGISGGQVNLTSEIENYLGFGKITGAELAINFTNHSKLYNFQTINEEVIKLKKNESFYKLKLLSGKEIHSQTVILATGGRSRKLKIPGEDKFYGSGVSYCATCDGFFFKEKTVLVVGGGDSAVEEALYLSKLCYRVYLSHRRNTLRASKMLQKRMFENNKIKPLWNTVPTAIIGNDDSVSKVTLMNTETKKTENLKVDGVFVLIGYEPNNQLVPKEIALDFKGMVKTNESCETGMEGLYAIGDLRSKLDRQIILSVADGCNAALAVSRYIENVKD